MAIVYQEEKRLFTLQTKNSTWQMQVSPYGHLLHVYYGRKVEKTAMDYLAAGMNRGFSGSPYRAFFEDRGYSLDTCPQEYSAFGTGDYRESCLEIEHADGSRAAELVYVSHKILPGKYALPGLPALWDDAGEGQKAEAQTLEIVLKDTASQAEVVLYYGVFAEYDAITRACQIRNHGEKPVILHRALSACLDLCRDDLDLLSFYGRHTMERMPERRKIGHGKLSVDSVRGTSSHQQNPFVILCETAANEDYGECFGAGLVYSGNFLASAELDQINQTRFVMGIHPAGFLYTLAAGESFTAPEVVFTFSGEGYGALSRKIHRLYRKHLIRSKYKEIRRPVLLNHWEAMDFSFHEEDLVSLAESAGELGVELFVMDDGWFGARNDDLSGLGDWQVNREKIPSGIGGLAERIHGLGMQFGIWIEPEMINEDSNLFRTHPDWCLRIPGRLPNVERGQLVLDMSRKEVRDYLFAEISAVLEEGKINYVKWDMNRNLSDVWSKALPAGRQGEAYHRYVLGVYALMERFVTAFPDILWEGCSGGGGRFDAGILYYIPQIWCSDNTDAVERLQIQYGTSFGYPVSSMGSHVSASPNMQTGRSTLMATRAAVAMAGSFGYELDVRKLCEKEREEIREEIREFKQFYLLIHYGDYYRLTNAKEDREFTAWAFVNEEKTEALIFAVTLRARSNPPFIRLRVKGLLEDAFYQVKGVYPGNGFSSANGAYPGNGFSSANGSCLGNGRCLGKEEKNVYEGSALMYGGILLPVVSGDYQGMRFWIKKV